MNPSYNFVTMAVWQLELFGGVSLRSETRTLGDLVGKKAGALLALLALAPGRTRPREEVIDLLWPEVDYEEARVRFRQVLAQLRKLLEPPGVAPGSVIIADRTQVGIAQEHQSDVARFLQYLRRAANSAEPAERVRNLRAALALYTGEFAPGFYVDALLTERERLAALAESARERLATLEVTLPETDTGPILSEQPLVTPKVRTANRFFGREHERAQLRELLQSHRLVTLLGPGGTGKTRLAQELLAELPGAHFISLSALQNGENIADSIVSALTLPDSNDTAIARLQTAFAEKPALLVLDNLEQLMATGGAESVAALLEALPTVSFLVTSRITLNLPQECVYRLGPLIRPVAIELFVDRARLANSHFEQVGESQEAISELCRRLDGLPLAIELAAARAAMLTPQQILERLSRRFDLLADKRRDREERHMSLRAALDWGWSLLAPDVQRFFTQLCVFRGSFSLEATEAITGESLAIDLLQNLVDASFLLVESGGIGPRFVLLETLREYGEEKLDAAERPALFQRHSDFFLAQGNLWRNKIFGDVVHVKRLFKQDHDNLLAAFERAMKTDLRRALELIGPMTAYWEFNFSSRQYLPYLEELHSHLHTIEASYLELAKFNTTLAIQYLQTQTYDRAVTYTAEALEYRRKDLARGEAKGVSEEERKRLLLMVAGALHNAGASCYFTGQLDKAWEYYSEAEPLNRYVKHDSWRARNLDGLCDVCAHRAFLTEDATERRKHLEQGLAFIEEAVGLCRALQQPFFLAGLLSNLLRVQLGLDWDTEARKTLAEILPLSLEHHEWAALTTCLFGCHYLALKEEHWEEAALLLGAALGVSKRWEVDANLNLQTYLRARQSEREALPARLGQERYEALYDSGASASVESLSAHIEKFFKNSLSQ